MSIVESQGALVLRAVQRLSRRLRTERPERSVTLSSLGLLGTLHRRGPMPAADLARAERLQPQSLTRLIAGLEAAGLIGRTPGTQDRRTLLIAITAKGRQVLGADMRARRAWLETAMDSLLTDEDRAVLVRAADIMLRLAG